MSSPTSDTDGIAFDEDDAYDFWFTFALLSAGAIAAGIAIAYIAAAIVS